MKLLEVTTPSVTDVPNFPVQSKLGHVTYKRTFSKEHYDLCKSKKRSALTFDRGSCAGGNLQSVDGDFETSIYRLETFHQIYVLS